MADGPVAVVARLPGGGHGVRVIDARQADAPSLLLTADEWRALLPKIEAACVQAQGPVMEERAWG